MASKKALSFSDRKLFLDGKPFRIFSGAIHYFRVVPEYWRDRLLKAKACGLNTVETYVPWNLHEPRPGYFHSEGILDLRGFIKMASELGLYVIFRPGPYICSEWDFGGLPSWLLADPEMKVRTNYKGYQDAVRRYFSWLLSEVVDLQYSAGGPIIAVQVENEYGSFSEDPAHLEFIRDVLLENGVTELLVTSDNESASETAPTLEGVLPTANGQTVDEVKASFQMIRRLDDQYPLIVMEFWSGWFDHWGKDHETRSVETLVKTLEYAFENNASVNFYMFHGGTNFAFMAGALDLTRFKADVTSYDYDAPLTEDGRVTEKFWKIREMLKNEMEKLGLESTILLGSAVPEPPNRATSPVVVQIEERLSWCDLIELVKKRAVSIDPQWMENYTYANDTVQSYGYVVYRKVLDSEVGQLISFTGHIRDNASILINGRIKAETDWVVENPVVKLSERSGDISGGSQVLDIVVENLGRVNYTTKDKQDLLNSQRKGMQGPVKLHGKHIQNWDVFALDFCDDYITEISRSPSWKPLKASPGAGKPSGGPAMYRASFQLPDCPADYFVRLDGWHKGVVIVNGVNLGRYWDVGPQRTLYLPGPLLQRGANQVIVFEEKSAPREITLDIEPSLG